MIDGDSAKSNENAETAGEGGGEAITPSEVQIPNRNNNDLDRAVVHAANVLQTLAENQRALRESVERAERTEILLQNVSGLNETFRTIAATQARLLDSMNAADRRREEAEQRASRSRIWTLTFAAGFLAFTIVGVYTVSELLKTKENQKDVVLAAINADLESRRGERRAELQELAGSFRDALSDRKSYEAKIDELNKKEAELQKNLEENNHTKESAGAELERAKKELAEIRGKVAEYQQKVVDEGEGVQRVMNILNSKGLSVDALRASLKKQPPPAPLDPKAQAAPETAETTKTSDITKIDPVVSKSVEGPPLSPASDQMINELNVLLAFASATDMRLVDTAGRSGFELRDCYFTRYNNFGKPSGFTVAKRAFFTEAPNDPKLSLHLADGYDLTGTIKIPFAQKTFDFRAVDPTDWKRRLPELLTGIAASDLMNKALLDSSPSAKPAAANPNTADLRERINKILSAHPEYLRLQIIDITNVDGETLLGVQLHTFVVDRGAKDPRLDETIRAREAKISYVAAQQRLEIELKDGVRGRDRAIPFLGGKVTLLIPNVTPPEIENEPTLPIHKR